MEAILCCHGSFPEDIIRDIFTRLPVKPLIRFESLCKAYANLIKSPDFIADHYRFSSQNRSSLLLKRVKGFPLNYDLISLQNQMKNLKEIKVSIPEIIPNSYVRMLGSSNGLVCVSYPSERQGQHVVSLWNPATRRFQRLLETRCGHVVFGYSPLLNDYKVMIICKDPSFRYLQFVVYSSKTSSFTVVDGHETPPMFFEDHYVNVNGILYWLGEDWTKMKPLLSFDLNENTFRQIKLPFDAKPNVTLASYKDSVAIFYYDLENAYGDGIVDLWMLENITGKNPWIKVFSIGPMSPGERPLTVWKDEILIMRKEIGNDDDDDEEAKTVLLLCDSDGKTKCVATHPVEGFSRRSRFLFGYAESLAGFENVHEVEADDFEEKERKDSRKSPFDLLDSLPYCVSIEKSSLELF